MQELEKKQDTQRDSVAQSAMKTYEAELLRDSDSPVVGNPNGDVTIVEFMGATSQPGARGTDSP